MNALKTKDAAELLSVSQTTIKRWISSFPTFFPKDRFGHYIFTDKEISLLRHIKDCVDHGEALDVIDLNASPQPPQPLEDKNPTHSYDHSLGDMMSRIHNIERSLDQKADEVVSIQLLQQREELEELRQTIHQLAVTLESIQKPNGKIYSLYEEMHPAAAAKLQTPPRKRSLLRSFFSFF